MKLKYWNFLANFIIHNRKDEQHLNLNAQNSENEMRELLPFSSTLRGYSRKSKNNKAKIPNSRYNDK